MTITYQIDLINIGVAVIAGFGLYGTWSQLRQQKLEVRASVLLSLDERWSSENIQKALQEMNKLIMRVRRTITDENPTLDAKSKRKLRFAKYAEELKKMEASSADEYYTLMKICGFFDTVGYVSQANYVPLGDILKLFEPALDDVSGFFKIHIKELELEYEKPMYEYFTWLIEQAEKNWCKCRKELKV